MSDTLARPVPGGSAPPRSNAVVAVLAFAGIVVSLMQTLVIPIVPELPKYLNASPSNAIWALRLISAPQSACPRYTRREGHSYHRIWNLRQRVAD